MPRSCSPGCSAQKQGGPCLIGYESLPLPRAASEQRCFKALDVVPAKIVESTTIVVRVVVWSESLETTYLSLSDYPLFRLHLFIWA